MHFGIIRVLDKNTVVFYNPKPRLSLANGKGSAMTTPCLKSGWPFFSAT